MGAIEVPQAGQPFDWRQVAHIGLGEIEVLQARQPFDRRQVAHIGLGAPKTLKPVSPLRGDRSLTRVCRNKTLQPGQSLEWRQVTYLRPAAIKGPQASQCRER